MKDGQIEPERRPANHLTPEMTHAVIMVAAGTMVLAFGVIFGGGLLGIVVMLVGLAILGVGGAQLFRAQKQRSGG